ncbi:hypothetical protein EJV47_23755 [Hymenobacter gummosus]|uniref:Uncharacterized protein n=1 Tax=Hymenobacter gummosus TaxID=1776032 RepID=A0A3S0H602_9BACT|nr:hypothetical protein [Hymenobacter gummosus]RTQ45848.1 hypothetical protein EJV47_23755 [Hymenobacter gummosus]
MARSSVATPAASASEVAGPGPLSLAARRLLGVCRAHHGRAVGLSFLALRAGLGRGHVAELLPELAAAHLVHYTSSAAPLWAPREPWHPALRFAAGPCSWGLVCEVPTGQPHCYQQVAGPGCFATEAAAQAAADELNEVAPPRLRAADRYAALPAPAWDEAPHPWEVK